MASMTGRAFLKAIARWATLCSRPEGILLSGAADEFEIVARSAADSNH
jgi:hypothetical protein